MEGWWTFSLLNVAYSTLVIGGIVWHKMRGMRTELRAAYEDLKKSIPIALIGEAFVATRFDRIEQMLKEYNARLAEVEGLVEKLLGNNQGG